MRIDIERIEKQATNKQKFKGRGKKNFYGPFYYHASSAEARKILAAESLEYSSEVDPNLFDDDYVFIADLQPIIQSSNYVAEDGEPLARIIEFYTLEKPTTFSTRVGMTEEMMVFWSFSDELTLPIKISRVINYKSNEF